MKITEDVRKYAAEQGIADQDTRSMKAKAKEFMENGTEVLRKGERREHCLGKGME